MIPFIPNPIQVAASQIPTLFMSQDRIGLVTFAEEGRTDIMLGADYKEFEQTLPSIIMGGYSNVGAGIRKAREELKSERHRFKARQVIIIVSNGTTPYDASTAIDAATEAKAEGIRIFTIGFQGSNINLLQSLATSPSDAYFPPSSSDLTGTYAAIKASLIASNN